MNLILDMPYSTALAEPEDTRVSLNKLKRVLTATIQKFSPTGQHETTKICLLEEVEGQSGVWRIRTGLVHMIREVAPTFGLAINITQDKRPAQWPLQPLNGINRDISLRPYQDELVTQLLKNDMGVMEAATGAGKTRMAAAMIARTGASTLFLVHKKDLLDQARTSLGELLQTKIGALGDGIRDIQPITVGMVQTMVNMDEQMYWDMVIVDETHHLPADTFYAVTGKFKSRRVYGLSATAYRQDKADLMIEAGAGPISAKAGASALIRADSLVRPVIRFVPMVDQMVYKQLQGWLVYDRFLVKNERRNTLIAAFARDFSVDRDQSTVVYVRHIKHAELISDKLRASHTPFVTLDGKDDSETRKRVLQQLRDREIKLVISTLFQEGVDVPSLECMINAAGGVDTMQLVGRVLRKSPGKKVATVIDFMDSSHVQLQRASWARFKRLREEPEFIVTLG
jgi:superfamily II DNA or RNA helicase